MKRPNNRLGVRAFLARTGSTIFGDLTTDHDRGEWSASRPPPDHVRSPARTRRLAAARPRKGRPDHHCAESRYRDLRRITDAEGAGRDRKETERGQPHDAGCRGAVGVSRNVVHRAHHLPRDPVAWATIKSEHHTAGCVRKPLRFRGGDSSIETVSVTTS
jgi:hypothetical protein